MHSIIVSKIEDQSHGALAISIIIRNVNRKWSFLVAEQFTLPCSTEEITRENIKTYAIAPMCSLTHMLKDPKGS